MKVAGDEQQLLEGLSGLHPTDVGTIQVNCSAPADGFERYLPLFTSIITSVQIDESLRYRHRSPLVRALGTPSEILRDAIMGVVIALAVGLVARFMKRRKEKTKPAETH